MEKKRDREEMRPRRNFGERMRVSKVFFVKSFDIRCMESILLSLSLWLVIKSTSHGMC